MVLFFFFQILKHLNLSRKESEGVRSICLGEGMLTTYSLRGGEVLYPLKKDWRGSCAQEVIGRSKFKIGQGLGQLKLSFGLSPEKLKKLKIGSKPRQWKRGFKHEVVQNQQVRKEREQTTNEQHLRPRKTFLRDDERRLAHLDLTSFEIYFCTILFQKSIYYRKI